MIHTQNKVMADKWHAHKLALEAHYATKPVPSNNYEGTSKDALGTLKSDRSMNHKRVTTAGKAGDASSGAAGGRNPNFFWFANTNFEDPCLTSFTMLRPKLK
mgnify:CR=1 FL=1